MIAPPPVPSDRSYACASNAKSDGDFAVRHRADHLSDRPHVGLGQLRRAAAPDVLRSCDWLKVVGIDTNRVSTKVIELHSLRNRPLCRFVDHAVGRDSSSALREPSIPLSRPLAGPLPTTGPLVDLVCHPPVDTIDLAAVATDVHLRLSRDVSAGTMRGLGDRRRVPATALADARRVRSGGRAGDDPAGMPRHEPGWFAGDEYAIGSGFRCERCSLPAPAHAQPRRVGFFVGILGSRHLCPPNQDGEAPLAGGVDAPAGPFCATRIVPKIAEASQNRGDVPDAARPAPDGDDGAELPGAGRGDVPQDGGLAVRRFRVRLEAIVAMPAGADPGLIWGGVEVDLTARGRHLWRMALEEEEIVGWEELP